MKEKIKNKLFDTTQKKIFIIFLIVFLFIFIGGILSINYINDSITHNHVHTDTVVVTNKMHEDNAFSDCYLIEGDNNKTYSILNHKDNYGQEMFNKIIVGKKYKFIVKDPELTDTNQFIHIMQVYNVTD